MNSLSIGAPLPHNEGERLSALRQFGILDTSPAQGFDALTSLAGHLFKVPTVLVSLVDQDRQWFKSRVGLAACQTERSIAFCAWALLEDDILEVTDPLGDPRFAKNPLVTGDMHLRYYAGAQLRTKDGLILGTLCLLDSKARAPLTPDERQTLKTLAGAVMAEMENHGARIQAEIALAAARELEKITQERMGQLAEQIKTPLTSVLGYSQLLHKVGTGASDGGLDEQQTERLLGYAQSIHDAGQSVLELVNIGLEPLRSNTHREGPEICDLFSVLDEVRAMVAPLIEGRGRIMRLSLEGRLSVEVNRRYLKQVILALVSNAIYHVDDGDVHVEVAAAPPRNGTQDEAQGLPILLTVADQGPGLSDQARDILLSPTMAIPQQDETGGLHLVRLLCHMMGVELAVNQDDQGHRIVIAMPAVSVP